MAKIGKKFIAGLAGLIGLTCVANADKLEVRTSGSTGVNNSFMTLANYSGASILADAYDNLTAPPTTLPKLQPVTSPYGTTLYGDYHGLNDDSLFSVKLIGNSSGASINTTTNRVRFTFLESKDTNRVYLAKLDRFAQNNSSGQDIILFTNIVDSITAGGGTYGYFNLPGIQNLVNGGQYGSLEVSDEFINKTNITSKNIPVQIDLTAKQFSGLNYAVADTSKLNGSVEVANGIATYTPAIGYTNNLTGGQGTNRFTYNILDPSNNVLATMTRNVAVAHTDSAPIVGTNSFVGQKNQPVPFYFIASDPDGQAFGIEVLGTNSNRVHVNGTNATVDAIQGFTGLEGIVYRATNALSSDLGQVNVSWTNTPPEFGNLPAWVTNMYPQIYSGKLKIANDILPVVTDKDGDKIEYVTMLSGDPRLTVYPNLGNGYAAMSRQPIGQIDKTNYPFSIVVNDGTANFTNQYTLKVQPFPTPTLLSNIDRSGGQLNISAFGVPGYIYDLMSKTNLNDPWTTSCVITSTPTGSINYSKPATNAQEFFGYRGSIVGELTP